MLRPVSLLPALVVVVTLLAGPTAPAEAAGAARPAEEATPLSVTIETLSPSAIPRKGPVRVSGRVTNEDVETWTDINLYAFVGDTPMTTQEELAAAAEVPETTEVGERIIVEGTYDTVEELAPGEAADFTFTVPRTEIPVVTEGVYWFGVHAVGTGPEGRIDGADGRARTFMPLIDRTGPNDDRSVDTALVLPIRRAVHHAPDGSIAHPRRWTRALERGGALSSPVELGATAGSTRPISWLIDPAVIDAVRRLAAGNPPRSLAPTVTEGEDEGEGGDDGEDGTGSGSPDPTATDEPSGDSSAAPDGEEGEDGEDGEEPDPRLVAAATAATAWLARLEQAVAGQQILTLPYGDLDVAAAADEDPDAYRDARKRSSGDLMPWGLSTTPAVASPSGYLDAAAIAQVEPGATTLVTDRMFGPTSDEESGRDAPAVAVTDGHRLVVSSSAAASGGPGPDERLTTVAVRQRIASEAAVRLLAPQQAPLFVVFPATWTPEVDSNFFAGLDDLPWLDLTSVETAQQGVTPTDVPVERLDYPEEQEEAELDATSFAAADDLVAAGETLQNLLTLNDEVAAEVRDEAFTDLSYASRADPAGAAARASSSRLWIETRLRSVRIDAPKAVILSSGSGRFAATVSNDLDQPVSVKIRATAEAPLEVSVPAETIELGAGTRRTVLLNASSSATGIRTLTLQLTDTDDAPLGSSADLPIRSNRVSNVIWVIVGTGIALLFGAIAVRLFRRIRTARRT